MSLLLALQLALGALDPMPDAPPPPPYQPPAEEIAAPDDPPPVLPGPHAYLYQAYPGLARKLDCMIGRESSWDPGASAVGGRYVGLAQFDYPTWLETPPGKQGRSRWDPYASIDGMAWGVTHLGFGRWPVTSRLC
jgi:hypothetical protein